jgi:SAM-dependent methyltransferase
VTTEDGLFPVKLVCPHCRIPGPDGRLIVSYLMPAAVGPDGKVGDRCALCGTSYPRIEGIRCVPPDLQVFHEAQADALNSEWICLDRESALEACRRASELDPIGDTFREVLLLALHALAHFPDATGLLGTELACNRLLHATVRTWLERTPWPENTAARCILEAGCGPGALLQTVAPLFAGGALGLDVRIAVLRLARRMAQRGEAVIPFCIEGRRFEPLHLRVSVGSTLPADSIRLVLGDILAPPLEAEVFPVVMALSLLDTVTDPLIALGQLDALLAPGGLLLLGTPYSWDPKIIPPKEWWSGPDGLGSETLRLALSGRNPVLPHLRYEILTEADRLTWAIPGHGRLVFRFFLDMLLARKCSR